MWLHNIMHFWPPFLYFSLFYLGSIYKLTFFLRLFIKLLLNHSNGKHNDTMWILGGENSLWHSTHFSVCIFPTGLCCQEHYSHFGFWHVLQSAVSCRCYNVCEVSWLVLTVYFAEPEVCILKYWETEDCDWVKVMYFSRGLCKCCFCPLLEEFMHL